MVTLDDVIFQKLFTSLVKLLDKHLTLEENVDQMLATMQQQPQEEVPEEEIIGGESGE